MSAFVVSKAHIDAMVHAGLRVTVHRHSPLSWLTPEELPGPADYQPGEPWGPTAIETAQRARRTLTRETANQVGAMLWAENRRSVNHRYAEDEIEPGPYVYARPRNDGYGPVAILKAIDCYEYQACEHPEWERSEAHAFCQALRKAMIHGLPGYEGAAWEIGE